MNDRHVREGLREVPHEPAAGSVVLLGEESEVIGELEQMLEKNSRLAQPSGQHACIGQPERTGQEGALPAAEAIRGAASGLGPLTIGPPLNPIGTVSGGALLDSLATLGHRPADIEAIALTHLHPDHFAWTWQPSPGGDQPPFADTDILVAEPEWTQRHFADAQGIPDWIATIAPRVRTVTEGEKVFPGVRVVFAPGHSAGHAAYVITVGDQWVLAFGDAFHSPIQVTHALWKNTFDHDHARASRLRIKLLAELNEPDTIGFGIHFADVPFGRVNLDSGMPTWQPVDA